MMMHDHELDCHVKSMDCFLQGLVHSEGLDHPEKSVSHASKTSRAFASRLGMVAHYHEPMCSMRSLQYYGQDEGHRKGSNPKGPDSF